MFTVSNPVIVRNYKSSIDICHLVINGHALDYNNCDNHKCLQTDH